MIRRLGLLFFIVLCVVDFVVSFRLGGFARPRRYVSMSTSEALNGVTEVKPSKTSAEVAQQRAVNGKSWLKCKPIGVGACPGKTVLGNQAFESLVDTSDSWIAKRTGIRRRHVLEEGSSLRSISVSAAEQALKSCGLTGKDIDLVIVATSSPDDLFGDAGSVASAVGCDNAAAFDLTAACAGFLYGLVTASQFLHSGAYKRVLLVGADALTRFLDWEDRGTCILFGDGAGAMVLEATETAQESGLLGFALHSDGNRYENLRVPYTPAFSALKNTEASVVDQGSYGKLTMNGAEVYKFAVSEVPAVISEALANAGLSIQDVDWLLLHQANYRIMEHTAQALGLSMDQVLRNIDEYGNTSAASIPLALTESVTNGSEDNDKDSSRIEPPERKVKPGDVVVISGFGAGLSWGAAVIKWAGK